jgi:DNA-binding beta-propeller fold protein YncE
LLGTNPPLQGKTIEQLQATSTFLLALLTTLVSGVGLFYLARAWPFSQLARLLSLTFFGILALLTARTAYTASFINYDYANEYLVYAHSAPGPKLVLEQVEDISRRTTDGLAIAVAYDDKTTYPYWWYFRNYPNARFYGANPTRDLRELPIIIAGSANYDKIEPIVGQAFYPFDFVRLWWPNQDYFNLTWERIWNALRNPAMRSALFQVWLNRDHTEYSQVVDRDMSFPNWEPSERMRMYVRKDIAAKIWNYGVGPSPEEVVADPYEGKETKLTADIMFGLPGAEPGQFNRPRDLAVAPDGTLYVADTDNHRIQHLSRDGEVLHTWGSFADISKGPAPAGTFYEPWGIAVGPDGSVYVADTWNHRIQKFSPSGEFIKMWGYFGQAEAPEAFWGPRDVIVDASGRLLVTDTGNKRIAIFDTNGNFLNQFGSEGFDPGQFYEPVGMALDDQGRLYVADTWNQRIQVFEPDEAVGYSPVNSWDVYAWFGQSLDNKPYLSFGGPGHLFATDPEGYRVLEFSQDGEIVRFWGDYSTGPDGFGMAGSVAADPAGGVWVSDTGNNRILHFNLPEE